MTIIIPYSVVPFEVPGTLLRPTQSNEQEPSYLQRAHKLAWDEKLTVRKGQSEVCPLGNPEVL